MELLGGKKEAAAAASEGARCTTDSAAEYTQEELNKLDMMRIYLERKDPSFKQEQDKVDNVMLRRFLRARDMNVEKAGELFCRYHKWRRSFVPNGYITESEIPNEIAQNKMFLQGLDKKQRPITMVLAARHFQNKKGGVDEFKRFVVYGLDKICSRMPEGQEKFLAIGDLKGWGYSNSDLRGYLEALAILQDCYPERLGKLYIVHAPRIFMTVWKIVYPFIDPKTKTKIVFLEDKRLTSTLLEDIDEDQLPELYGGKKALVPIHQS